MIFLGLIPVVINFLVSISFKFSSIVNKSVNIHFKLIWLTEEVQMGVMGIASASTPTWWFFTGLCLRVLLFLAPSVTNWLSGRVELNTPVNSWKRVVEAIALDKAGISPYGRSVSRVLVPIRLSSNNCMHQILVVLNSNEFPPFTGSFKSSDTI